jgi:hypothetical protein
MRATCWQHEHKRMVQQQPMAFAQYILLPTGKVYIHLVPTGMVPDALQCVQYL